MITHTHTHIHTDARAHKITPIHTKSPHTLAHTYTCLNVNVHVLKCDYKSIFALQLRIYAANSDSLIFFPLSFYLSGIGMMVKMRPGFNPRSRQSKDSKMVLNAS